MIWGRFKKTVKETGEASAAPTGPERDEQNAAWGSDVSDERKRQLELRSVEWEEESGFSLRPPPTTGTVPTPPGGPDDPEVRRWFVINDLGDVGPFSEYELSGADVFWLSKRALAGAGGDIEVAASQFRRAEQLGGVLVLDLSDLQLQGATLNGCNLTGAALAGAQLQRADLRNASLRFADLMDARLTRAVLAGSDLTGASLAGAQLSRAFLNHANLSGADLRGAHLEEADLRHAILDSTTALSDVSLSGALLDQVVLDDANLTVVDWSAALPLGDETQAASSKNSEEAEIPRSRLGRSDQVLGPSNNGADQVVVLRLAAKSHNQRADEYRGAGRAYRALAVALRNQGVPREPGEFHYRSELMERRGLFHQVKGEVSEKQWRAALQSCGRWMFSLGLGVFAGYGDRLGRLALTYACVVLLFTGIFLGVAHHHHRWTVSNGVDALSLSVTAFHGRGFIPSKDSISRAGAGIAATESVVGLFLEALVIAAFTRRVIAGT